MKDAIAYAKRIEHDQETSFVDLKPFNQIERFSTTTTPIWSQDFVATIPLTEQDYALQSVLGKQRAANPKRYEQTGNEFPARSDPLHVSAFKRILGSEFLDRIAQDTRNIQKKAYVETDLNLLKSPDRRLVDHVLNETACERLEALAWRGHDGVGYDKQRKRTLNPYEDFIGLPLPELCL
ncbi:unnamed protein product, partial [Cyprideis torosa]